MKLTPKKAQWVIALVIIFAVVVDTVIDQRQVEQQAVRLDQLTAQISSGEVCGNPATRVQCAFGNATALLTDAVPLMVIQHIVEVAAKRNWDKDPQERTKIEQEYYQLMSGFYAEKLIARNHRFDLHFARLTTKNFDLISARNLLKEMENKPEYALMSNPLRVSVEKVQ